jgi:DNA-binding IclR family transcriptional regulator
MLSLYDIMETTEETDFTVGEYYYMHSSATGKAILATYSEEKVNEVIDEWGLPAQTKNTITDRDELFTELEEIRSRGYAINDQEITEGLYSVGAVVREPDGSILGGISVGGPAYRLSQDTIEKAARPLLDAVELLETRIENLRTNP